MSKTQGSEEHGNVASLGNMVSLTRGMAERWEERQTQNSQSCKAWWHRAEQLALRADTMVTSEGLDSRKGTCDSSFRDRLPPPPMEWCGQHQAWSAQGMLAETGQSQLLPPTV